MRFQHGVADFIEKKGPALTSQIPPIKIAQGEVSVDVPQPYKIMDLDKGTVLAIIDTTGKTFSLEGTDALVLLTKTELIFKKSDVETRIISLKKTDLFTLDQQRVAGWLRAFKDFGAVALFSGGVIGLFAARIAQLLIYAAIGLLFAKWRKTSQPYPTLLRLSVMAITPVIIVNMIVGMAGVTIPWHGLLNFIAAMVYLSMGVKAVSRPKDADSQGHLT